MTDWKDDKPRYTHDCEKCMYLGNFEKYDLYWCMQGVNIPTVIARYGDEGSEYTSGWEIDVPPLNEARLRVFKQLGEFVEAQAQQQQYVQDVAGILELIDATQPLGDGGD